MADLKEEKKDSLVLSQNDALGDILHAQEEHLEKDQVSRNLDKFEDRWIKKRISDNEI